MPNKRTIPRVCQHCGADFLANAWKVSQGRGLYCSTDCGHARGEPDEEAHWSSLSIADDCWLWPGRTQSRGYGSLTVDGQSVLAHRRAWVRATGSAIPRGKVIGHVCDVRLCVRHDEVGTYEVSGVLYERRGHLWLGTQAANLADMVAKGRAAEGARNGHYTHPEAVTRGEECSWAKVTAADVHEMFRLSRQGMSSSQIAMSFPVNRRQISRILTGERWKHLS